MNTDFLREEFAIPGCVSISDVAPSYPVIEISNTYATARIGVHGGQVLSFRPAAEEEVLWLSKDAVYREGKSVRGGIPICWPWFGTLPNSDLPSHGFVRNRFWQLREVLQHEDEVTEVVLSTNSDAQSLSLWPHAFELQLRVRIGKTLSLALTMTNTASEAVELSGALHSYFAIGDIAHIEVQGLEGAPYIDALNDNERRTQAGAIRFDAELDRIYQNTSDDEYICDAERQRTLHLQKLGSASTVVWNPWIAKSSRMDDFEEEGYRRMVCVETGNMGNDFVSLPSGSAHTLGVTIAVVRGAIQR